MASESCAPLEERRQGVDNFRALLKGHIDIFEYLNSDHAATTATPAGSLLDAELTAVACKPEDEMDTDVIMAYSQHPQGQGVPLLQPLNGAANPKRPPAYRTYGNGQLRLPESPPETDSGAGSAGSPSGSDASPYSPGYQNYNGSVIIHPTTMGVLPTAADVAQQPDVILDVHTLDTLSHQSAGDFLTVHGDRISLNELVNNPINNAAGFYGGHSPSVVHSPSISSSSYSSYNLPPPRAQQQQPPPPPPPQQQPSQTTGFLADSSSLSRKRPRTGADMGKGADPLASPLSVIGEEGYFDDPSTAASSSSSHQTIRFSEFQQELWHKLCDANGRELSQIGLHVVADKGFNYSQFDSAFVNQKKNHFQVSVHIEVRDRQAPKLLQVHCDGCVALKPIAEFQLDFYGVKTEMPSSVVQIKQSQTDRKPIAYESVKLDLPPNRVTKVTVARLHFSETTMNNQRKNGRPNPDQKYFYLVVALSAVTTSGEKCSILAYHSEKVIVRASNPGQFDNGESETHWQKGQVGNSIYHPGPVGIGTDRPTAALTVSGDLSCTGSVYHPSDVRLKQNIKEVNCAEALSRLSQIRIVQYDLKPEVQRQWNVSTDQPSAPRVGVIAQEVHDVLPDAVKSNGDFLTVDDSRIFYESAAAVKELCRLTGNLEYKIEEVEKIGKKLSKLNKLKRFDSFRSSLSGKTTSLAGAGLCPSASSLNGSLLSCSLASVLSRKAGGGGGDKRDDEADDRRPSRACRYHKRYCSRLNVDDGLCSSKVIQATIIVLVLVMAFCLISMATLYVLDWHKRNAFRSHDILSLTMPASRLSKEFETKDELASVPRDPGLMSLQVTSPASIDLASSKGGGSEWPPPPLLPVATPKPLNPCNRLPCEQFCCPYSYQHYSSDGSPSLDDPTVVLMLENKNSSPVGADFSSGYRQISKVTVSRTGESSKTVAVDYLSLLLTPITFDILNLNVTIGSEYCFGSACGDLRTGNLTYAIPVSSYMPHMSLEVQFNFNGKERMQYCSQEVGQLCHGIQPHFADPRQVHGPDADVGYITSVQQRQYDTWELPVGVYILSAYKFRVGPSTSLCLLPDDEAGSSFIEYNLVFYRICGD